MSTTSSSRTKATAIGALCLSLPLWLGSCGVGADTPAGDPSSSVTQPITGTDDLQTPNVPAPAPQPQPVPAPVPAPAPASIPPLGSTAPATTAPNTAPISPNPGPSGPNSALISPTSPETLLPSAPATPVPSSTITLSAPAPTPSIDGITVYYVRLDDGGSSGVRFGCNDSLVALSDSTPGAGEPLQRALTRLLEGGDNANGLYNALAGSTLQYLSGYFDGTTVVVKLTGSVQPGGVCDLPRIEAQLTQTAITATGAARAEIYIDGVSLSQALRLR